MSEHKTVTPDMIDDELVEAIRKEDIWVGRLQESIVRHTLAYVANNPRVPREEDSIAMQQQWNYGPDIIAAKFFSVEWQRRAYLKKEEELPSKVKDLLIHGSDLQINQPQDNEREVNARIVKAYRLGLENGGKK